MNRDTLAVVLEFLVDFSGGLQLCVSCSRLVKVARVSRVFAQAVRVRVNRDALELTARLCRLLEYRDASKTVATTLFGDQALHFFPVAVVPRARQIVPLMEFVRKVIQGGGARQLVEAAEDRPRRKRLRDQEREERRVAKRQRSADRTKELTTALQARDLPVNWSHPALQKYCDGGVKTMKLAFKAMTALKKEEQALETMRQLEEPEIHELRSMTADERKARLQLVCKEFGVNWVLYDPLVTSFMDGTLGASTGFVCGAIFLINAAGRIPGCSIEGIRSLLLNQGPLWRQLIVHTALHALGKDSRVPTLADAWMSSAKKLEPHLRHSSPILVKKFTCGLFFFRCFFS